MSNSPAPVILAQASAYTPLLVPRTTIAFVQHESGLSLLQPRCRHELQVAGQVAARRSGTFSVSSERHSHSAMYHRPDNHKIDVMHIVPSTLGTGAKMRRNLHKRRGFDSATTQVDEMITTYAESSTRAALITRQINKVADKTIGLQSRFDVRYVVPQGDVGNDCRGISLISD